MARIFTCVLISPFFFSFVSSINISYFNSAAYIPTDLTGTALISGTCSQCICSMLTSNNFSIYKAVNCFLNNNTCLLVKNITSTSSIRIAQNSKLAILRPTINNTTPESCPSSWQQCNGGSGSYNCCTGWSCVYVNQWYSQCQPSSAVVSTSRNASTGLFWGCCKPSCGWSGKGSVSNPVKTCQKDGNTSIDINTVSGCNSGDSYLCTNQHLWNVSSNLSYGFVGAYIKGKDETQWCCTCYSLVFTSGSILGKELIVQVVDTVYTTDNSFVLLVPGGGWTGTSNGCERQYDPVHYYWGSYNDGFANRSDCANLPAGLRSGCYWRFDWFENAQRPSVNWTEVSCPSVLTSITGCVRY